METDPPGAAPSEAPAQAQGQGLPPELLQHLQDLMMRQSQLEQAVAAQFQASGQDAAAATQADAERAQLLLENDRLREQLRLAGETAPRGASSLKVPRPAKFSGAKNTVDLRTFLFQMGQYYEAAGVASDRDRVLFMGLQLEGRAAAYYRYLCQQQDEKGIPFTYAELCHALCSEHLPFDPAQVARDRLQVLIQKDKASVHTYTSQFRMLVLQVPSMTEDEKLHKYMYGLAPTYQLEVSKARPTSVEDAQRIAEEYESTLRRVQNRSKGPRGGRFAGMPALELISSGGPVPMELNAVHATPARDGKKLTPERKKYLRENGLCWYCEKPGHIAAECPAKRRSGNPRAQ